MILLIIIKFVKQVMLEVVASSFVRAMDHDTIVRHCKTSETTAEPSTSSKYTSEHNST